MSRDIVIANNIKFRRKSIFDSLRLYKMVWGWLEFNGFKAKEDYYRDNTDPKGSKIIEFHWTAIKNESAYFRYQIKLSTLLVGVKSVEVEQNGRKIKLESADIEFRMSVMLILDPDSKFEKNVFTKAFKPFYERVVINQRIEEHKTDIYTKAYTLQEEVKNYLGMYA